MDPEARARQLCADIIGRYKDIIDNDEQQRDAVIVKAMALMVLAYGIPAIEGQPIDVKEALQKLYAAEQILAGH